MQTFQIICSYLQNLDAEIWHADPNSVAQIEGNCADFNLFEEIEVMDLKKNADMKLFGLQICRI
jgi:hypothetical protein